MPTSKQPLCIIPARGKSRRIPRKNLALLAGIPLLAHTIRAAKDSGVFRRICVSSDDPEILELAEKEGATPLLRPSDLAGDTVAVAPICLHVLATLAGNGETYDTFAMLQPTCPLRTAEDVRKAHAVFTKSDADVVLSAHISPHPLQRALQMTNGFLHPFSGAGNMERQSQDLEPLYLNNGAINVMKTSVFQREKTFFVPRAVPYVMPEERSVDIDEPLHLAWAEFLLSRS